MTFIEKADQLKPQLIHTDKKPISVVEVVEQPSAFQGFGVKKLCDVSFPITLKSGNSVILDFGEHVVGYVSFKLNFSGSIPDSPTRLSFLFGELPCEVYYPPEHATGGLKNWLQDDSRAYPFLPCEGRLERRYAFRYMKITRTDNAKGFDIDLTNIVCDSVSAVSMDSVAPLKSADEQLTAIDRVSLNTLKECMQEVFEDGPKRDRRLWIGDLRLEVLTDYVTFKNIDIIKRCLYLFAGLTGQNGRVHPCLFENSYPFKPDYFLSDYSLIFIACLYDYAVYTGDKEFVEELYPVAEAQFRYVCTMYDENKGMPSAGHIDWCIGLDKATPFEGIFLYTARQLAELAQMLGKDNRNILKTIAKVDRHMRSLKDLESGLIVSGESRQLSSTSQVWAVLSGAFDEVECREILLKMDSFEFEYTMHSPYMYHYYVEALYKAGLNDKAEEVIRNYWGKMVDLGADCFFEVFNPENEREAPYGDFVTNSACHAWSCTASYWIRTKIV